MKYCKNETVPLRSHHRAVFYSSQDRFSGRKYDTLYFGDEFCERRLPDDKELAQITELCKTQRLKPVFVTPFLTEPGVKRAEEIIKSSVAELPELEIVANDWGLVYLSRRRFPHQAVWLGRIITSRYILFIPDRRERHDDSREAVCTEFPEHFIDYICTHRIRGVEFNSVSHMHAAYPGLLQKSIKAALYIPFSYLTVNRYCFSAVLGNQEYRSGIYSCRKECMVSALTLKNTYIKRCLYAKGNALFLRQDKDRKRKPITIERIIDNENAIMD